MFQNPREADAMTKVQAELDETKVVLVSTASLWLYVKRCMHHLPLMIWIKIDSKATYYEPVQLKSLVIYTDLSELMWWASCVREHLEPKGRFLTQESQ